MINILPGQADEAAKAARKFEQDNAAFLKRVQAKGFQDCAEPEDCEAPEAPTRQPVRSVAGTPAQVAEIRRLLKAKKQPQKVLAQSMDITLRTLSNWLHRRTHLDEMRAAVEALPVADDKPKAPAERSSKKRAPRSAVSSSVHALPDKPTTIFDQPAPVAASLPAAAAEHVKPLPLRSWDALLDQLKQKIRNLPPAQRAAFDAWYGPQALITQQIAALTAERNRLEKL